MEKTFRYRDEKFSISLSSNKASVNVKTPTFSASLAEIKMLAVLADEYSPYEAADELNISIATLRSSVQRLKKKNTIEGNRPTLGQILERAFINELLFPSTIHRLETLREELRNS